MGQVYSNILPGLPYNTIPERLKIHEFQCFANTACSDTDPDTSIPGETSPQGLISGRMNDDLQKFQVYRADRRPITFVQEPEHDNLVLQIPYSQSITMKFILSVTVDKTRGFKNLAVAHASSAEVLHEVISSGNLDNQISIGNFEPQEQTETKKIEIKLVWDSEEDSIGGQPIHFAFFERDSTGEFNILSGAALWIAERTDIIDPLFEEPRPYLSSNKEASLLSPTSPQDTPGPNDSIDSKLLSTNSNVPLVTPGGNLNLQNNNNLLGQSNMTNSGSIESYAASRPSAENVPQMEDGPQFRTAVASMEKMMPGLKARVKQILKRTLLSKERLEALIEADEWLAASIKGAAKYELPTLKPIAPWFSRYTEGGLSAIQRQRKVALNEINTRIVEPLQKFYDYDVKAFEMKKRDFEEMSNQFYSWTSKYLSSKKDIRRKLSEPSDTKFASKKKVFDLARFDYFNYLNEITSGLKQQILLQLFALTAQTFTDSSIALGNSMSEKTRPAIDETVEDIKDAARLWEKYRLESIETRRSLASDANDANIQYDSVNLNPNSRRQSSPDLDNSVAGVNENYKEGLLWASSRPGGLQEFNVPNKQALQNIKWHKYWVVLDGSTLREYSNWKQNADLHNEPINLLVATAKEANRCDRRFCFEVVTPQYKRVYQATSEDEVKSWISTINKSISNLIESTDDQGNVKPTGSSSSSSNTSTDRQLSGPSQSLHSNLQSKSSPHIAVSKAIGSENLGNLTRKLSLKLDKDKPKVPPIKTTFHSTPPPVPIHPSANNHSDELLNKIKLIQSNDKCAECETTKGVEWVSINLLVVLCIDCSGAHRSLGTHISKVKSLTLDTGAFTPSLQKALLSVSNEKINDIWEARMPAGRKITPDANIQAKVKFVSEKYVEKRFVKEVEKPNSLLRKAVHDNNILLECEALASRANPNSVSDDDVPLLIDALRCSPVEATAFPIAEVLSKNGAELPAMSNIPKLAPCAVKYLEEKHQQL